MWINRIFATVLKTTHMNFTNILCIVQEWQYSGRFLFIALLVLISLRMWRNIQELRTQISTQSYWKHFSASSSARFAVVPTRWSNSSYSTNFCASPQDSVSQQTHFSWPTCSPNFAVPDNFLWGYVRSKVYKLHETRPANVYDLKHQILECVQGIPKPLLYRVITAFPLQLQECIERHGGHLQSVIFKQ